MSKFEKLEDKWIDKIRNADAAGDFSIALSLCEQAIIETQDSPAIFEVAGMIAYKNGLSELAIEYIQTAMFEIRLSLASQLVLAKACIEQGKLDVAETALEFLVEMIEQVPCPMLPDLTHAVAEINKLEWAITICRTAYSRHPDDDNAIFGAAYYMHHAGYPLELVKNLLVRAIHLSPNCSVYRINMATVCCTLGHWREAYFHACRLSERSLRSIPCGCMARNMQNLFQKFGDENRLALVKQNESK